MKTTTILSALSAAAFTMAAPDRVQKRYTRETSHNWSGAVVTGSNITGISATFPVINPHVPTIGEVGKDAYFATAWLGIDGYKSTDECPGLWQAGVQSENQTLSKEVSYMVFYELYPLSPVFIDLGKITAGDNIYVDLSTNDALTQASVIIKNLNTGISYNQTTDITQPLCFHATEWVIERTYSLSGLAGLADFGDYSFSNISYTQAGQVKTTIPDNNNTVLKDIIDEARNNTKQTYSSVTANTVNIQYIAG